MDPNDKENQTRDWVEARLSGLTTPKGWEPDVEHGFELLHEHSRRRAGERQAWVWAGVAAAFACLAFLVVPLLHTATGKGATPQMPTGIEVPAALFDESDQLVFPSDYRKWVYVGTSLGLSYTEGRIKTDSRERPQFFQNVYIDPRAYTHYTETGEFPDGTVMVLEVTTSEVKNEAGLEGIYEDEIVGVEASVRDTSRFDTGWAYFSFTNRPGGMRQVAESLPDESCWTCHDDHAETDHVFTQFYPVL